MNRNTLNNILSYYSSSYKYYLLLFIIWPFLSFLMAVSNFRQKEARRIIYIFFIYYGLTYYIYWWGIDAFVYAYRLEANAKLPFSRFFEIVGGLYSDTSVDIIEPLISFIVSRFTDSYPYLFAVYAAFFGFFYIKSINLVHPRILDNSNWNTKIFMFFFAVILPITSINAFRMWTAAWVFFFGAYHVILFRDYRFFLLSLGACLVHWSFLLANAVLVIYFIAGNRNFIYAPLALVSFVMPNLLVPVFSSLSMGLGGSLGNRYSGYTNEDYSSLYYESWEQASWYLTLGKDLIFYFLVIMLFVILLFYRDMMQEKSEKNLLSFLFLFLAFVNFGVALPNFAHRFKIVFMIFATLYIILFQIKLSDKRLNMVSIFGVLPVALYTILEFRLASEYINAWIILPGFGIPFLVPGSTLYEVLFG